MGDLTSELNSTIQKGDTTLEQSLIDTLTGLSDGVHEVANGTLTIATTEDSLDTLTGTWGTLNPTLLATDWFTGTETADASLYALVAELKDSTAYFAFDTDTSWNGTVKVDTLYWDGDSVEVMTFLGNTSVNYATGVTEGGTIATWDSNKGFLEGLSFTAGDLTLQVV